MAVDSNPLFAAPVADDPLGVHWQEDFMKVCGRSPTDADRQDRLFSLIFSGSGPGSTWIDSDWASYGNNRQAFWGGQESWPAGDLPEGYDRFQSHLELLAGYYLTNQGGLAKFSRAAGLIWGGIFYEGSAFIALAKASVGRHHLQLHEGASGWQAQLVDDLNPAHHWVAAFLTGFCYGTFIGATINTIRDGAQYVTGQGGARGDIYLGNIAALHGHLLSHELATEPDPYGELFSRMRKDLSIRKDGDEAISVTPA